MNTDQATNATPEAVYLTAMLGPIDAATIDCWRQNYGLDRTPHELHALWNSCAPPGAVLALRAAVLELERLRALLARYRDETPLGHQPHMIAHQTDEALGRA